MGSHLLTSGLAFKFEKMAWTWTGYDHDAVHRFKDNNFFQTGRNKAEDRFWKMQIHGEQDRRGTRSSISVGGYAESVTSGGHTNADGKHSHTKYSYSHDCPRERSNSVISTLSSRMRQFGPSRDYPYSYPGDLSEEEQEIIDKEKEDEEDKEKEDEVKEEGEEEDNTVPKELEKKNDKLEIKETKAQNETKEESESDQNGAKNEQTDDKLKKEKDLEAAIKEMREYYKNNPLMNDLIIDSNKIMLANDNHISSRFY